MFDALMEHRVTVEYPSTTRDAGGGESLSWTTRVTGVACLLNVGGGASEQERFDQQGLVGSVVGATYYTGIARGDRITVTAGPSLVGAALRLTGLKVQPGVEMLGIDTLVHFTAEEQK
jgi:hypothetical protein